MTDEELGWFGRELAKELSAEMTKRLMDFLGENVIDLKLFVQDLSERVATLERRGEGDEWK